MREALGFDARELTPGVIRKITVLGAETRSFKRAAIALQEADVNVSAKTVERVMHDVGEELAERRDIPPRSRWNLGSVSWERSRLGRCGV